MMLPAIPLCLFLAAGSSRLAYLCFSRGQQMIEKQQAHSSWPIIMGWVLVSLLILLVMVIINTAIDQYRRAKEKELEQCFA